MKSLRIWGVLFAAVLVSLGLIVSMSPAALASPGLVVQDLDPLTPTDLVNALVGGGVSISNISFVGDNSAAGAFSSGGGIIGFDEGIILSSGDVGFVVGPNAVDGVTKVNGLSGDVDLDTLIPGYRTYDAAVLEFDFVPTGDTLSFQYVFGSEEYNEWVNSEFNDVFGFFVNGVNQAMIPGTSTPVSINNVNNGDPYDTDPRSNPEYYRNNDLDDGGGTIDTELDGLTVVLSLTATVNAGETNHIKLAIADAGDYVLDSDVFIKAGSLVSTPALGLLPLDDTNPVGTYHELTAIATLSGVAQSGVTVDFAVVAGPHAGITGSDVTDANGMAIWSYQGTTAGTDEIVATATIGETLNTSNSVYKTWEPAAGPTITLTPTGVTNPVGTNHTVTATVLDETGAPIVGIEVTFFISDGPNYGREGFSSTDEKGEATWTYTSNGEEGTDTIQACCGVYGVGAPTTAVVAPSLCSDEVTKTWVKPVPPIPELSTIVLFGIGLFVLAGSAVLIKSRASAA